MLRAMCHLAVMGVLAVGMTPARAQTPLSWQFPSGGETFVTGSTIQLKWTGGDPNKQMVIYLMDAVNTWPIAHLVVPAGTTTPNDGEYTWTIPPASTLPYGGPPRDYFLHIKDVGPTTNWASSGTFRIVPDQTNVAPAPVSPSGLLARPIFRVMKVAPANCQVGSPCNYAITITNVGSTGYSGPLTLREMSSPTGLPITIQDPSGSSWPCANATTDTTCTGTVNLPAGASLSLTSTLQIPGNFTGSYANNCFSLVGMKMADNVGRVCTTAVIAAAQDGGDQAPGNGGSGGQTGGGNGTQGGNDGSGDNNPGLQFATEHFQCYDIADRPGMKIPVKLVDQFGGSDNTVIRPKYLCAPVDKNGEGMKNEKDHLLFYELERQVPAGKMVEVENQFGKQRFKVLGSRLLGVSLCLSPPWLGLGVRSKWGPVQCPCTTILTCDFLLHQENYSPSPHEISRPSDHEK